MRLRGSEYLEEGVSSLLERIKDAARRRRRPRLVADGDRGESRRGAIARQRLPARPEPLVRGGVAQAEVTEVDGVQLHLSTRSSTGYEGVVRFRAAPSTSCHVQFKAQAPLTLGRETIGYYGTAVEAAVAYATYVAEHQTAGQGASASEANATVRSRGARGKPLVGRSVVSHLRMALRGP